MGSPWLPEYRPAVVPAPAGPFRSLEHSDAKSSDRLRSSSARHWIPPDVAFLKEVLSALILLAAASGTVVFLTPLRIRRYLRWDRDFTLTSLGLGLGLGV
jgi:hypothetical protein